MKLYEIDKQIAAILDAIFVDEETGEIKGDIGALDALRIERDKKLENLALYVKDLDGDIEKLRAEKKRLDTRIKYAEKKSERLSAFLEARFTERVNETGDKAMETERTRISFRQSRAAVVTDWEQFSKWATPAGLIKTTTTEDKVGLLKYLNTASERGETPPGAQIIKRTHLQIK